MELSFSDLHPKNTKCHLNVGSDEFPHWWSALCFKKLSVDVSAMLQRFPELMDGFSLDNI